MPADDVGPRHVSWSFRRIAGRVRRLDPVGLAAVQEAWPSVGAASASGARPLKVSDDELVVAVDTGAHAARARRDAAAILAELAAIVANAPTSMRVVVRPPT